MQDCFIRDWGNEQIRILGFNLLIAKTVSTRTLSTTAPKKKVFQKSNLINKNSTNKRKQRNLYAQFIEYIDVHSAAKQLSDKSNTNGTCFP